MSICENCGSEHDGSFATGRFCNYKCSKSFSTKAKRKEINEKVSKTLKNNKPWNKGISNLIELCCSICEKHFYVNNCYKTRKTCSKQCYLEAVKLDGIYNKAPGGYRKGSGRSKGSYYKEQYFDSPFEIEVAKYLDENNIKWKRNTKRFYFTYKDKETYYIPDFYLIEQELYLETKGYWYSDKKEKTYEAVRQNNINWILLMQKEEWNINKNILLNKIYGPVV